jgi:hypothetical protein
MKSVDLKSPLCRQKTRWDGSYLYMMLCNLLCIYVHKLLFFKFWRCLCKDCKYLVIEMCGVASTGGNVRHGENVRWLERRVLRYGISSWIRKFKL